MDDNTKTKPKKVHTRTISLLIPQPKPRQKPNYQKYVELQTLSQKLLKEINQSTLHRTTLAFPKLLSSTSQRSMHCYHYATSSIDITSKKSLMRPTIGSQMKTKDEMKDTGTFFNVLQESEGVNKLFQKQFKIIQRIYSSGDDMPASLNR